MQDITPNIYKTLSMVKEGLTDGSLNLCLASKFLSECKKELNNPSLPPVRSGDFHINSNIVEKQREELYEVECLLIEKEAEQRRKQNNTIIDKEVNVLPPEIDIPENLLPYIEKARGEGLMIGNKWVKTASLFGYFVCKVTEVCDMRSTNNRITWQAFKFVENYEGILSTAKSCVNDFTNKELPPPEGDDIVNKILK